MTLDDDRFRRSLSRLRGLRANVIDPSEDYVLEYHSIVDSLQSTGIDLTEFKISDTLIAHRVSSVSPRSGVKYTKKRYVEKGYFLAKIDGLIDYLEEIIKR